MKPENVNHDVMILIGLAAEQKPNLPTASKEQQKKGEICFTHTSSLQN